MSEELRQAFAEIGAQLAQDLRGQRFGINIISLQHQEAYQFRYPLQGELWIEVLDVHPRLRHLVLDVSGDRLPVSGRFLCGHDESHWFVAGLQFGRKSASVRGAMESLKPDLVKREQRRQQVRHQRDRRQNRAYTRQGEWFFLPRPKMRVPDWQVERDGQLSRPGGKPHRVDELYRAPERDEVFVRGRVQHEDHQTIEFDVWQRVVQNNEHAADSGLILRQQPSMIEWED
jgi:hypothetical protein